MSWAPLLLVLSALCAGALALPVLTQDPSEEVSPGEPTTLKCVMTEDKFESFCVLWVQQKAGRAPRFILRYCRTSGVTRGEGVPDRFSGSKDEAANEGYLKIEGALPEDDAVYSCHVWEDTAKERTWWIFGGGTQLNVLSGETKGPTLSIFPPSQEEVAKDKSTVVCLYQDFYPASVDVTWTVGGQTITNGVEKSRATKQSENNLRQPILFHKSTRYEVAAHMNQSLGWYVVLWHSVFIFGGGTQLNVLTGETKGPTLSIFPPSQEEVEKDKSTVVCLYQDFYPASVDVTWTVGGQTITNGVEKSRATKQSENNLFMASSYLSLSTTDWSTNKEVTCQVTHQGKSFAKSVKKSECV
ncbi:hypothetical protein NDU88_006827 [Pleurodeles waltl]|uniref:Ig-like domain-containing protein n=1 Tax=Pleurodeles waltl TaxID=8319 RepID=A0AAV7LQA7_PLEWA|nr:hypothetical protein NDU88_006827 [Pleurodeles waltl]